MSKRIEALRLPKWERKEIMAENLKTDIDYIYLALNLIPIQNGRAAIAPGAITDIEHDEEQGHFVITLHGGTIYTLSAAQMIELEQTIRKRAEDNKELEREAFKRRILMQASVQHELQSGITAAPGMIIDPNGRQH